MRDRLEAARDYREHWLHPKRRANSLPPRRDLELEVLDAIPYNGAVMHRAGVLVSFNPDDAELARRLNHEAAKAIKYGGVEPSEALKFVTLNPVKQLRIDNWVGSISIGTQADLGIWNRSPLSTLSVCM